jgi:cytidine deaminase
MTTLPKELERLIEHARAARERAYAPYSRFQVGAAIETADGHIFEGCNVENASYGATLCAERSAVTAMVLAGERSIVRVAVYTEAAELTMPCGICRQVLVEFGRGATVVVASKDGSKVTTLSELFPDPFLFDPPPLSSA